MSFYDDLAAFARGERGVWDTVNSVKKYKGPGGAEHGAADSVDEVARRNQQFSQDQWNRQMQGLQGAQNALAPAQNWFNSTYGQQGPSNSQNFWNQSQSAWGTPSAQSSTFKQFQDWMNNPANNATQNGATKASQYMTGPTASSQAYNQMGGVLQGYNAPSAGARTFSGNEAAYNTAGSGEQWWQQNQNAFNTGGQNGQNVFGQASQQLSGPGRSEGFQVNMPNYLQGNNAARQSFANDAPLGVRNETENKGYIRNADQLSNYFQSQLGTLSGPGAFEQFVMQDISGTNPELERARAKSMAGINQEMARRGHFDSGGAAIALGEAEGAFQAADYQNRAQRAQQAQQMGLSRIGTGGGLAGQAAGLDINRGTALQGIDNANEAAGLARQQFGLQSDEASSRESLQGQQLGLQAAGQSDAAQLARLQGLAAMGQQVDQNHLQWLQAGQDAANQAQTQQLARLRDAQGAAGQVDQTQIAGDNQALQRMLASFNMAQGSDASNLARAQELFSQGQGIDQAALARFGMLGDQAQAFDANSLARLMGQGQLAGQADQMEYQRLRDAMNAQMGISGANADLWGQFYGQGGQLSGNAFSDAMNAYANAAGLRAEGDAAPWNLFSQALGVGGQIGAGYVGGKRR